MEQSILWQPYKCHQVTSCRCSSLRLKFYFNVAQPEIIKCLLLSLQDLWLNSLSIKQLLYFFMTWHIYSTLRSKCWIYFRVDFPFNCRHSIIHREVWVTVSSSPHSLIRVIYRGVGVLSAMARKMSSWQHAVQLSPTWWWSPSMAWKCTSGASKSKITLFCTAVWYDHP